MQKNRVKQALAFHWFGLGSNFRIKRLLNETLIKKDNKLECLLSEEEIMTLLELVPLANPISRTHSFEDECFERLIYCPKFRESKKMRDETRFRCKLS